MRNPLKKGAILFSILLGLASCTANTTSHNHEAPVGYAIDHPPKEKNHPLAVAPAAADVSCIDDGVSGPRVQAVYAVSSDMPDRFDTILPYIQGWAGQMDDALNASAAETGGERHIRWVTNNCILDVAHVVMSPTGDDTFGNSINELKAQGFNLQNRRYVMWVDAQNYCGIGMVGSINGADPMYGRIDQGCWGRTDHLSELHEFMHTLGAVDISAPHTTGGWHCTDEYDALCYNDGGSTNIVMTYPCAQSHEWLLDCNHDDYFSTNPVADSWLALHPQYNTAFSVYLWPNTLPPPSPSPSPSPSPTVSPTPSPSPSPTPTCVPRGKSGKCK